MEKQNERIKKFSKVLYILAKIAFIVLIVTGALTFFSWIFTLTDTLTIFKLGDVTVVLPTLDWGNDGLDVPYINEMLVNFGFDQIMKIILSIIVLGFLLSLLRTLKEGAMPFSQDIAAKLKKLAIVLLISGFFTDGSAFIAAGITGLFYFVVEYACSKEEKNTDVPPC